MYTVGAGCKMYMHPQNATVGGSPITLTCDPFLSNTSSTSNTELPNVVWRRFFQQDKAQMQSFINNCATNCEENCTFSYTRFNVSDRTDGLSVLNNSLTVENVGNNHAWFVPSVKIGSCTYVAPMTLFVCSIRKALTSK